MTMVADPHDSYRAFLDHKRLVAPATGVTVDRSSLPAFLFEFQRDITFWALRKGRSAVFAGTGMGKTAIQLAWAERAAARVLIVAPLAVAQQTVREGERWGIRVTYSRAQADAAPAGITITNYEMLEHFDPSAFGGVVLDESGCLKNFSGVRKKQLVETFRQTPMRLCCTATPAPNDVVELCNHADFLSVMSPAEMISTFFTPRGQVGASGQDQAGLFRLKRYARDAFFRWLASWSISLTKPSDLGYPDDGFVLPPLAIRPVIVSTDWRPDDQLFFTALKGVTERAAVRRDTVAGRVAATVEVVNAEPDEQWLIWCGLNAESEAVTRAIPGAVEVRGSDSPDDKAAALLAFASGRTRVLVTKPSIAGYGLNFQSCARMAFVGLGDSFETYYQAIRRCWRFGQTRPVDAYIILSTVEQAVYDNVLCKEREATDLTAELVRHVAAFERAEIGHGRTVVDDYQPARSIRVPDWLKPTIPTPTAEEVLA